jgi:hypothetical protein
LKIIQTRSANSEQYKPEEGAQLSHDCAVDRTVSALADIKFEKNDLLPGPALEHSIFNRQGD